MDTRRARIDHRLHQLERVQHAAEAGLGIGDDRREEIDVALAFHVLDLVGAHQRVVDPAHDLRHRVDRIERLVRIHLAGDVGVGGDLPARKVDRLQAGLHLLQRLVAGHRAERVHERLVVHQLPQLLRAAARERVLDVNRSAQAHDVLRRVAALDALPAGVFRPVLLESCRFQIVAHRHTPIVCVMANPRPPLRAARNLGQRSPRRHRSSRRDNRSVKRMASPAARRFTARTVEDHSAGRAGMDGVETPGPSCSRDRGWSAAARDMAAN